jgi:hypothetical protein
MHIICKSFPRLPQTQNKSQINSREKAAAPSFFYDPKPLQVGGKHFQKRAPRKKEKYSQGMLRGVVGKEKELTRARSTLSPPRTYT